MFNDLLTVYTDDFYPSAILYIYISYYAWTFGESDNMSNTLILIYSGHKSVKLI